ncbi:UrcA family protein [Asaia krungthepensis]|uniref:UrcA family protein n=1 Tax=Asaia krungthepensis NRIC 0535 TaxID=1307925 RepID=A0ABQ0Q4A1_9PROT|nr:UrcA family protein [Asaia krungthepensis]GBQ90533.1 hypothetical protein AA0535_2070 [Asaia krungthepensis NRIC 0535]
MFTFAKSIAAATTVIALAAQPALAQDQVVATASPNQSAQIDVSHVNLKSDRDWNRVADAIHAKAADICERDTAASDRREADVEDCTQAAYENGVQQMRNIYARRMVADQTRLARS